MLHPIRLLLFVCVAWPASHPTVTHAEPTTPSHRLSFFVGMAATRGGNDWERTLSRADYGATLTSWSGAGDWVVEHTVDYPEQFSQRDGLFYAGLRARVSQKLDIGLHVNQGTPFKGWRGVKADTGSSGRRELTVDPSRIRSICPLVYLATGDDVVRYAIGTGPSYHDVEFTWSNGQETETLDKRFFGWTLRATMDVLRRHFLLGFCAEYNWLGAVELDGATIGDPEFPDSEFGMNYGYIGIHLGLGI